MPTYELLQGTESLNRVLKYSIDISVSVTSISVDDTVQCERASSTSRFLVLKPHRLESDDLVF